MLPAFSSHLGMNALRAQQGKASHQPQVPGQSPAPDRPSPPPTDSTSYLVLLHDIAQCTLSAVYAAVMLIKETHGESPGTLCIQAPMPAAARSLCQPCLPQPQPQPQPPARQASAHICGLAAARHPEALVNHQALRNDHLPASMQHPAAGPSNQCSLVGRYGGK